MVIPLVSPQLELLPVHFAVDPGLNYNWQDADECTCFDLPPDKKTCLIEQYMDVKLSMMPLSDRVKRSEAVDQLKLSTMPRMDGRKQPEAFVRLTHHRRGSLDSAPPDLLVGARRLEDGKKQRSAGISRQICGVVMKTFGSLGQSVSEKLKSVTSGSKSNKLSVGSTTQSSRRSTLAVRMLSSHQQVQWIL